MTCPDCGGDGFYVDHAQTCNGWDSGICCCAGEKYPCEKCQGTGEIK